MSAETLHEMKSRHKENIEKGSKVHEACKSDGTAAELGPVTDEDVYSEEDRYVAVDEKPSTFVGTFSDSEDELDIKFVQ